MRKIKKKKIGKENMIRKKTKGKRGRKVGGEEYLEKQKGERCKNTYRLNVLSIATASSQPNDTNSISEYDNQPINKPRNISAKNSHIRPNPPLKKCNFIMFRLVLEAARRSANYPSN